MKNIKKQVIKGMVLTLGLVAFYANTPLFLFAEDTSFPRIITPNGDGINDRIFFFFDNKTLMPVTGFVYDLQGYKVADVQESNLSSVNQSVLTWDGKDNSGAVVRSGVYIYLVKIGDRTHSGTVVVAK